MRRAPQIAPADALTYALLYRRISGAEHQKEGLSLDNQTLTTRVYAARDDSWLVAAEFEDVMSGKRADRPAYQRMLEHARQLRREGRAVAVVVVRLDRLGRNKAEYFRAAEELAKAGVQVHSIKDGGVLDETHAAILAVFAAREAALIGERVAETRAHLVSQGWFVGRPSFGYRLRPALEEDVKAGRARKVGASVYEPDPLTADVAREMFARVGDGQSATSVARWLAAQPSALRGGRVWRHKNVLQALRSPTYIAREATDYQAPEDVLSRPPMRWEALISDAAWSAVQARLAGHAQHPHQASGKYLLSGFLRCENCAGRMAATQHSDRRRVYRCQGKVNGAASADCAMVVPMAQADAAVLGQVEQVLGVFANPEWLPALRAAWERLRAPTDDGSLKLARIERELAAAKRRLAQAGRMLVEDGDRLTFEVLRDEEVATIKALTAEAADAAQANRPAAQLPPLDQVLASSGVWAEALREADTTAIRDVLAKLLEHATPRRVGYGKYQADIAWTPLGEALHSLLSAQKVA